ncbi:hypothetical protein LCGC14_2911360, partial [marine sediment metagenome]
EKHAVKTNANNDNFIIRDNIVTNVGTAGGLWTGFQIFFLQNGQVTNNIIDTTTYAGINLDTVTGSIISGNTISNTVSSGIQLANSPNSNSVISDNTITNANTGNSADKGAIAIYPNSNDVTIENNILNNNNNGFAVRNKSGVVASNVYVKNNKIENNNGFGVKNLAQGGGTLDATNNWWGTDNETEIQAPLIDGNVLYSPWYISEDMTSFGATVTEVDGENEVELPEMEFTADLEVENETKTITVSIPTGTTVTGSSDWTGVINPPTVKETATVAPSTAGFTSTVSKVIEVGLSGERLTFDKAVKIVIPGEFGKKVGYSYDGSTFTEITTVCGENNQTWANDNLLEGEDCYYNDGTDLIVWTKHFTEFVTYTQTALPTTTGAA